MLLKSSATDLYSVKYFVLFFIILKNKKKYLTLYKSVALDLKQMNLLNEKQLIWGYLRTHI